LRMMRKRPSMLSYVAPMPYMVAILR
jgi:hypothetical protein